MNMSSKEEVRAFVSQAFDLTYTNWLTSAEHNVPADQHDCFEKRRPYACFTLIVQPYAFQENHFHFKGGGGTFKKVENRRSKCFRQRATLTFIVAGVAVDETRSPLPIAPASHFLTFVNLRSPFPFSTRAL